MLVHCQGGNGRSGLFVAALYTYVGYNPEKAIQKVRKVRKYAIETNKQEEFALNLKF